MSPRAAAASTCHALAISRGHVRMIARSGSAGETGLMSLKVVAQFGDVHIYTRMASPDEAVGLAQARRTMGADGVWVYDQDWQFVGARELADLASRNRARPAAPPAPQPVHETTGIAWATRAIPATPLLDDMPGAGRRRVRVFKASKLHGE
ncbi:hypothetical protein [Methylobacterium sp. ID0610]|uniref:hypothetical protein n=1 Tax=Methylobacterium carpenticola TaxID=3344827 RepID=UPI00368C0C76